MRPTKGEIRVTLASAQAMAWWRPKSRVRLQWMPSCSRFSAALMPSQVEAILMRMRSRPMPASSYCLMMSRACCDGLVGVVGEACVDFGGDAAGDDFEDLLAEGDGEGLEGEGGDILVGGGGAGVLAGLHQHVVDDLGVGGHLGRGGDERWVGGGVGRLVLDDGVDVAGVGNDGGHGTKLFEKSCHRGSFCAGRVSLILPIRCECGSLEGEG